MFDLSGKTLRKHILRMAKAGNSVHVACAFSIVEIVSVLYSEFIKADEVGNKKDSSNWFVLSKGHGVMAMYAAHYQMGLLKDVHLDTYFSDGSVLHGLCEAKIPGFEVSSGSLGHGLPIAVGVSLGKKRWAQKGRVFCIIGDGEMNEGTIWEALMFAGHHQLENLTVIVDANGFQAMGKTENVMSLEPMRDKFEAFGFEVVECDGHDEKELIQAFQKENSKPIAVIARTIKGKGVSFMEDNNQWHYLRLNEDLYEAALVELK